MEILFENPRIMASSRKGGGAAEDAAEPAEELGKSQNNKGERILAPTRRPDGTLRKPVRIRAGYVPQDEVALYQSKGSIWRKEMEATQEAPPGYDPVAAEVKLKSKSAKRNERKKEKRQQAALDKADDSEKNDVLPSDGSNHQPDDEEPIASKMNGLTLSGNTLVTTPATPNESSTPEDQHIDKKIRALKKKIRLTEAQQQKTTENDMKPEQLEKIAKLEDWHNELKLLEEKKAELTASMS